MTGVKGVKMWPGKGELTLKQSSSSCIRFASRRLILPGMPCHRRWRKQTRPPEYIGDGLLNLSPPGLLQWLAGDDQHIPPRFNRRQLPPHGLAQQPLDPVSSHGLADTLADHKSKTTWPGLPLCFNQHNPAIGPCRPLVADLGDPHIAFQTICFF